MGVFDNFNRANNSTSLGVSTSGHTWTVLTAGTTWGISSNAAQMTGGTGTNSDVVLETGLADCTVSVHCFTGLPGGGGLTWRAVDANNQWFWVLDSSGGGNGSSVYKRVAGVLTQVATGLTQPANNTMSVVLSGSTMTLKIDGTTVTTITDSTHSTATKHGLHGYAGYEVLDDFSINGAKAGALKVNIGTQARPVWRKVGCGTPNYLNTVLGNVPAGYWRLGETSGTTAADSSGNSRSGTYIGPPTLGSTGLLAWDTTNKAVTFTGSTAQRVEISYNSWMNSATLTVEAVIKSTANATCSIVDRDDGVITPRVFQFRMWGNVIHFILISGSNASCAGTTPINDGKPHHVVATVEDLGTTRRVRVYVDGGLDGEVTTSLTLPQNSSNLYLGINHSSGFTQAFNGVIDEVAYYTTALTSEQVMDHAAAALAGRLKLWTGSEWVREKCDSDIFGVTDNFNRANGTSVLANRSDGGLWSIGDLSDMEINTNRLSRTGTGIGTVRRQWVWADYGYDQTVSITFDFARTGFKTWYCFFAHDNGNTEGYEVRSDPFGSNIRVQKTLGGAPASTLTTAAAPTWTDGVSRTVAITFNYSTGAITVDVGGTNYITYTDTGTKPTSTGVALFITGNYSGDGMWLDNVAVTGTGTAAPHPLKVWDSTTWQTGACMVTIPPPGGVYDTAVYDTATYG